MIVEPQAQLLVDSAENSQLNEPGKKLKFRIQLVSHACHFIPIVLYTFFGIFIEGSPAADGGIGDSSETNPENTSIREGKRGDICIFYVLY